MERYRQRGKFIREFSMTLRILPLATTPSPVSSLLKGAMAGQELTHNFYKNRMTQDQANYLPTALKNAARMAQAKIQGLNINNQYLPGMLGARTSLLQNQAQGEGIKNTLMPESVGINQENANTKALMAKQSGQRFGKAYALSRLIQTPAGKALLAANPELASAFGNIVGGLAGNINSQSSGPGATQFSPAQIKGAMQATGANLQKDTSDEITRQQALNAQQLVKENKEVDISPLKAYTGAFGKLQIYGNNLKSILQLPLSEQAVAYNTFKKDAVPIMSDQIRQALKTSVHPGYVTAMIKPLADPQSTIWDNPQEVQARWDYYTHWVKQYAKQKTLAVTQGVPISINGSTSGNASKTSGFNPAQWSSSVTKQDVGAKFSQLPPNQQAAVRAYLATQEGK